METFESFGLAVSSVVRARCSGSAMRTMRPPGRSDLRERAQYSVSLMDITIQRIWHATMTTSPVTGNQYEMTVVHT